MLKFPDEKNLECSFLSRKTFLLTQAIVFLLKYLKLLIFN